MKRVKLGDMLKDKDGKIWYYAGLDNTDYEGIPCIRLTYRKEDCKKPYANTTGRFSQTILIENGFDHVSRKQPQSNGIECIKNFGRRGETITTYQYHGRSYTYSDLLAAYRTQQRLLQRAIEAADTAATIKITNTDVREFLPGNMPGQAATAKT